MIDKSRCCCQWTITLLPFVLGLGIGFRLPLHVGRGVGSPAFQRVDVIDHPTGSSERIAGACHELFFCRFAAGDASVAIADTSGAIARAYASWCRRGDHHKGRRSRPRLRRDGMPTRGLSYGEAMSGEMPTR